MKHCFSKVDCVRHVQEIKTMQKNQQSSAGLSVNASAVQSFYQQPQSLMEADLCWWHLPQYPSSVAFRSKWHFKCQWCGWVSQQMVSSAKCSWSTDKNALNVTLREATFWYGNHVLRRQVPLPEAPLAWRPSLYGALHPPSRLPRVHLSARHTWNWLWDVRVDNDGERSFRRPPGLCLA